MTTARVSGSATPTPRKASVPGAEGAPAYSLDPTNMSDRDLMALVQKEGTLSKAARRELDAAATYFTNHRRRMDYVGFADKE